MMYFFKQPQAHLDYLLVDISGGAAGIDEETIYAYDSEYVLAEVPHPGFTTTPLLILSFENPEMVNI